jgi:Domain of unknown function (DUF1127)
MHITRHFMPLSLKTVRPTVIPDWFGQLRLLNRLGRWVQKRRAIHQLSAMSEFDLKDLGYPTHGNVMGDEKKR